MAGKRVGHAGIVVLHPWWPYICGGLRIMVALYPWWPYSHGGITAMVALCTVSLRL